MGHFKDKADQQADTKDIITLLSEYVNLPMAFSNAGNPTLAAWIKFIHYDDGFDWEAAEKSISELCATGKLCTVNQFRGVYYKLKKSTSGLMGCSACYETGVVRIVTYRDSEHKKHITQKAVACQTYIEVTPCTCEKGKATAVNWGIHFGSAQKRFDHHLEWMVAANVNAQSYKLWKGIHGEEPVPMPPMPPMPAEPDKRVFTVEDAAKHVELF